MALSMVVSMDPSEVDRRSVSYRLLRQSRNPRPIFSLRGMEVCTIMTAGRTVKNRSVRVLNANIEVST